MSYQQQPHGYAPEQYGVVPPIQPVSTQSPKWPWALVAIVAVLALGVYVVYDNRVQLGLSSAGPAPAPVATSGVQSLVASAKHVVVYEVTGTGSATSITYTTDGMASIQQESKVKLPWSKSVELPADEPFQMVSVTVVAGDGAAQITGKILVDGKVLKEGTSSGQFAVLSLNQNIGTLK